MISSTKIVQKLFNDIAPRFKERKGGYTRIMKVGRRKGDNAPLSIIELITQDEKKPTPGGTKGVKGKSTKQKASAKKAESK